MYSLHYHLHPLPPAITTLLSMFKSPLSCFAQSLHHLTFPLITAICSPSMSLSPFSLLVQFVYKIPHMNEIICYVSFSNWLISLSIMSSRSIDIVAKGKILSFFKKVLLLFNYRCMPFLPIPRPHPSRTNLTPPPPCTHLSSSMCPL